MISLFRRFTALDRSRRRLVLEAALSLAFFAVGIRALRFLTLRRIVDRYVVLTSANVGVEQPAAIDGVRWAVAAVAAHAHSLTCLVRALAADAMLRRRGIPTELRFGVRAQRPKSAAIEGHAWIECGNGAIIGVTDHQLEEFEVMRPARPR